MFPFFTLYVSCDILVPAEKYEETSQAAQSSFLLFSCYLFPFSSTTVQCNWLWPVFFCKSNYGFKQGCKILNSLSLSFFAISLTSLTSTLFCMILLYWNSPIWEHPLHFSVLCNTDNLWILLSHSWHWKACQNGFAQHLEHLLFYGADTSSQNASGNTALHISALYNKASMETNPLYKKTIMTVIIMPAFLKLLTDHFPSLNDQESCVRVLLYRGANKEAKNKHGQTPFQVNCLAANAVCIFIMFTKWNCICRVAFTNRT